MIEAPLLHSRETGLMKYQSIVRASAKQGVGVVVTALLSVLEMSGSIPMRIKSGHSVGNDQTGLPCFFGVRSCVALAPQRRDGAPLCVNSRK